MWEGQGGGSMHGGGPGSPFGRRWQRPGRFSACLQRGHELWEALSARPHASGLFDGLGAEEQRTPLALLTKMRRPGHR